MNSFQSSQKRKPFFIAIDSDGCVFDTMEVKHKECFCPVTIRHYGLQAISKFVRESWEFVNLYSLHRGMNRFPALVKVMEQLVQRPEVQRRNVQIPALEELKNWIQSTPKLGNPALSDAAKVHTALSDTLQWSEDINHSITEMVHGVPPFPYVHDALDEACMSADMIVASSTPEDALNREWKEHGLSQYIQMIAGQEMGAKSHQLSATAADHYPPSHMLMIGDAFSDYHAACSVGACFYPILPSEEESSWKRFIEEALPKFLKNQYVGAYQEELIQELRQRLPMHPPWHTSPIEK